MSCFGTWGNTVNGVFTWETAWPETDTIPQNVSTDFDQFVMTGTIADGKTYMAPSSSLQYKHLDGEN